MFLQCIVHAKPNASEAHRFVFAVQLCTLSQMPTEAQAHRFVFAVHCIVHAYTLWYRRRHWGVAENKITSVVFKRAQFAIGIRASMRCALKLEIIYLYFVVVGGVKF